VPHGRLHALSSSAAALVVAAATFLLAAAPAAQATPYGISEPQGLFASCPTHDDPCSSPSGIGGLWNDGAFTSLRSRGRWLQAVRLPVTYDAVATSDGAGGWALSMTIENVPGAGAAAGATAATAGVEDAAASAAADGALGAMACALPFVASTASGNVAVAAFAGASLFAA